jgi:hypothetical protein
VSSRVEPTPVDDLALMVWAELYESRQNGLAKWELQRRLPQLSKYQIGRGIDRINHVFQETGERPVVHFRERGRGAVYRLPDHCPDYKAFVLRRLREFTTRTNTELVRSKAALLRWPDSLAPYLPKLFDRTIRDIEEISEALSDEDDWP